jgi:proline dehydrogenase
VWVAVCAYVQASVCIKITALCPIALLEKASDLLRWQKRHPSLNLPWKTHAFPILSDSSPLHLTASEPPALSAEEERELELAHERVLAVCARCAERGVPLLVDAEYAAVQPAIDYLTLAGALACNAERSIVHGTVQAYLRDARERLETMARGAERARVRLGVKLVRGAYLAREARVAAALGVPSPVHGSIRETHDCYNGCAAFLLDRVRRGSASVVLATHNVESGNWPWPGKRLSLVVLVRALHPRCGVSPSDEMRWSCVADPRPTRGGAW